MGYIKNQIRNEINEVGRSETLNNKHDVEWKKRFVVIYNFEELRELKLDLYDRDSKSEDLSKHDFLGSTSLCLGELVASPGQTMFQPIHNKKGKKLKRGLITIRCEEVQ